MFRFLIQVCEKNIFVDEMLIIITKQIVFYYFLERFFFVAFLDCFTKYTH